MHDAQDLVAVRGAINYDADGEKDVDFLKRDALLDHLVEDGVEVLWPPFHLGANLSLFKSGLYFAF